MGFRRAELGGRYLQARKRGAQRLCFCSARFGVWEQWQVRSIAAFQPLLGALGFKGQGSALSRASGCSSASQRPTLPFVSASSV